MSRDDVERLSAKLDALAGDLTLGQRQLQEIVLAQGKRVDALERRVGGIEQVTAATIRQAVAGEIRGYLSPQRIAAGILMSAGVMDAVQRIISALS